MEHDDAFGESLWVSCESPVPGSRESAGKASVRSRKSSGRTAKDGGNLLPIQETNNYTMYPIGSMYGI